MIESTSQPEPTAAPGPPEATFEQPVIVTAKAAQMMKLTRGEEGLDESWGLRIGVVGGGCSGFQYALDFEKEARDGDAIWETGGMTIYVDAVSARYLLGTTVDYVMGMQGAGFKFNNPKAVGSCGCGSSFTV